MQRNWHAVERAFKLDTGRRLMHRGQFRRRVEHGLCHAINEFGREVRPRDEIVYSACRDFGFGRMSEIYLTTQTQRGFIEYDDVANGFI